MKILVVCILFLIATFSNWGYAEWKINSGPVKLTGGGAKIYMHPVWSPTGDRIAFTTIGYQGIWLLDMENLEIGKLTDAQGSGFGFSWSNDGKAIVCITTDYDGRIPFNQLKVFDVENNQSWTVTDGKQRFRGIPRWTIDDQQVYIMGRKSIHIFKTNLVPTAPETPSENRRMIYLKSGKIVVEEFDQGTRDVLEPVSGMGIINLVISPDGNKLAFEVYGGNMHVMNVDGSGLIDLGVGYRPQWSPDGEYLVYMITEDDGHRFTHSDIYTIRIDGTEKTNLTNTSDILEMNPSWSPDGNRIVFDDYNQGSIYMVEVEK